MPYILINTNKDISQDKKIALKTNFGKNISKIEGKTESRLMVNISDKNSMYFGGDDTKDIAFVEVRLYKSAPFEQKEKFVNSIFEGIYDILKIKKEDVFLSITEHNEWGTGGKLI